jgi:hypothetical protein
VATEEDPRAETDEGAREPSSDDLARDSQHDLASSAVIASAEETLRQLGDAPLPPDDSDGEMQEPKAEDEAASPSTGEEEEESIDDYMAKLLQRVRGGNEPAPPAAAWSAKSAPPKPAPTSPAPTRPAAEAKPSAEVPYPRPGVGKDRESVKLSPRAVAPETVADLSAMRELANFSAQHAIDRSHRRMLGRTAPAKLLVALLALLATGLLLWAWTRFGDMMLICGALVTLTATLFWSVQYLKLTGWILRRGSPKLSLRNKSKDK